MATQNQMMRIKWFFQTCRRLSSTPMEEGS